MKFNLKKNTTTKNAELTPSQIAAQLAQTSNNKKKIFFNMPFKKPSKKPNTSTPQNALQIISEAPSCLQTSHNIIQGKVNKRRFFFNKKQRAGASNFSNLSGVNPISPGN